MMEKPSKAFTDFSDLEEFKEASRDAAMDWCLADPYPTGNSGFLAGAKWAREHLLPKPEVKSPEEYLANSISQGLDKLNEDLFYQGVKSEKIHRPLTIDTLRKLMGDLTRHTHIHVVSTTYIPEDSIGILYVRPEDAERIKNV